jgi:hypothetical protein
VNGFLQANVPNAKVKHTKSGNWLRGIEILTNDQSNENDAGVKSR